MLRISGVVLPGQKRVMISLTAIKGIGRPMAMRILNDLHIDPLTKTDDLKETDQARIRASIEKELTKGKLTRKVSLDIKRLQDIDTWHGHRHKKKLPVHRQNSKRNTRTKHDKKKTGLSGRTMLTKT
jgi:small subunit ribosomal protein S13